jgi:hypothetical protein
LRRRCYGSNVDFARLRKLGASVVHEVVDYGSIYRLYHIRSPEGILIGLAQELEQRPSG